MELGKNILPNTKSSVATLAEKRRKGILVGGKGKGRSICVKV
jgi:hypothetical protein